MQTFYYKDELNDDFAGNNIKTKPLPENYKYIKTNPFRRAFDFCFYHFIATPIVTVIQKIIYGEKIVGKKKLKPYKKTGYFLYGNHTRAMGDAYAPTLISFPKKAYIIVGQDAVSIPFVKSIVESLGGIPLPSSLKNMRDFYSAITERAKRNQVITIYPEAHIWPFYTGIRNFADGSFLYPIKTCKPSFSFTATYKKRKIFGGVKCTVYIDGPFFGDENLPVKERQKELRNKIYETMLERSKNSTYQKNKYVKISD